MQKVLNPTNKQINLDHTFSIARPALLNSDDIFDENKLVTDPRNFCIQTNRSVMHKAPQRID